MKAVLNTIIIREARLSDLETLFTFEQGVIAAERPFDKTLKSGDIKYYDLRGMLESPDAHLVIAEHDGSLIGSGYARLKNAEKYLTHEQYAYLGFMYVLPEFRGQGVNQLIIKNLSNWAESRGVHELRLEVYYDNTPAIRAYEKLGFSRHMIEMRLNKHD